MAKLPGKVVMLHAHDSSRALENLNRITGLRFSHWPQSLVAASDERRLSTEAQRGDIDAPGEADQVFA